DIVSGAVYVFTRIANSWTQQAYIKASNAGAGDQFGFSVTLSGDTLAVGAWGEASTSTGIGGDESNNDADGSGAVYVFTRSASSWTQQAYIKASNTALFDFFGWSVALDGNTLAVGAYRERSNSTGIGGDETNNDANGSGAGYVFTRSGNTWAQQAYIKASNSFGGGPNGSGDNFGFSIALSGNTLAVGAIREASNATGIGGNEFNNDAFASGAVYVFARSGSNWAQQAYIKASNTEEFDTFGDSVALDGDTLVVGARNEDSNSTGIGGDESNNDADDSGAVYVFTRSASSWIQQAYIKPSNTGQLDSFGFSVALNGDTLAVGAYNEDSGATGIGGDESNDTGNLNSGAVYLFTLSGSSWTQQAYIKASNTDADDRFGIRVALSDGTLAVGASGEGSNSTGIDGGQGDDSIDDAGATYVFEIPPNG
ncbi:MAG: FG-GAP repeat protein, partial [Kangiellaceae bacterium]|nr:FG-GAP repeat protein [Kangiellaceae bacterium]